MSAHALPQHGVLDEDLGDVLRLHERLDHLRRHPLEAVFAEAERLLAGERALDLPELLVGEVALLQHVLRLLGDLAIEPDVLLEHRLHVHLRLGAVGDLDVARLDQTLHDLRTDRRDLSAVKTHLLGAL